MRWLALLAKPVVLGGVAGVVVLGGIAGVALRPHGEAEDLRQALIAAYPEGLRTCPSIGNRLGLQLDDWGEARPAQWWLAHSDVTGPTAHPFVFAAGFEGHGGLEVAEDLARRGILQRHSVSTIMRWDTVVPYFHPKIVRAVIYTTPRNDPDFRYARASSFGPGPSTLLATASYPDAKPRVWSSVPYPVPVPVQGPYLISVVSGVCVPLTLKRIEVQQHVVDPSSHENLISGTAVFRSQGPKDWMRTPVFRREIGELPGLQAGDEVRRGVLFRSLPGGPVVKALEDDR